MSDRSGENDMCAPLATSGSRVSDPSSTELRKIWTWVPLSARNTTLEPHLGAPAPIRKKRDLLAVR
jgi:hypothetical protein